MCCDSNPSAPEPKETEFSKTLAQIMRERNEAGKKFEPLVDQLIGSVQQFQTPQFASEQIGAAKSDVANAFDDQRKLLDERMVALNPNDPRRVALMRGLSIGQANATAGAARTAREGARRLAFDTLAGTSGRGDARIGQAIGAASAGEQGYIGRERNVLAAREQDDSGLAGFGSLLGTAAGFFLSSKRTKTNREPAKRALAAMREAPAQTYNYKRGLGAPGPHVGPMAEDMAKATGKGNGVAINAQDMLGLHHAAINELAGKVRRLEARK